MRSEKITIDLSEVELAQVDFLVEKGLYASRSDLISSAIRKETKEHKKEFEQFVGDSSHNLWDELEEFVDEIDNATFMGHFWGVGINVIKQRDVEAMIRAGEKINIRMIGSLTIEKDVDPEQFRQVLDCVKIYGKMNAEPEIKKMIEECK